MTFLRKLWFHLTDPTLQMDTDERKIWRAEKMRKRFKSCGPKLKICRGSYFSAPDNITLGYNVYVGIFCYIGVGDIEIGNNTLLGPYVSITANEHLFSRDQMNFRKGNDMRPIKIERDCFIAAHAVITSGVTIGRGSLVAAGAVVTRDVPERSIVAGIPATVVGKVDNPLIFSPKDQSQK